MATIIAAIDYVRAPMMAGVICCEHCAHMRIDPSRAIEYGACLAMRGSVRPERKACDYFFEPHHSLIKGGA